MVTTPLMLFAGSRTDAGFTFGPGPNGAQNPFNAPVDPAFANPTYVDSAIGMSSNQVIAYVYARDASGALTSVGAGHVFSSHAQWASSRGPTAFGSPAFVLCDSAGHPWLRAVPPGDNTLTLQYNSGTGASPVWTNVAGGAGVSVNNAPLDVAVTIDAGGAHQVLWAIDNSTVFNGVINMPGMTDLALVQWYSIDNGGVTYISEVMLAQDIALVNAHCKTLRATGAGFYTDWSGSYTDVNEVVINDGNFNLSATAGQNQTYDMTNVSLPAGYSIAGLFYGLRARNDGFTSPTNYKALLRTGGSNFLSGNLTPIGPAFGYNQYRWDQNPDTSAAWTESDINALQLGFQSAA